MLHSRRVSVSSTSSLSTSERANVSSLVNLVKDSPDLAHLCSTSIIEIPEERIFQVDAETSVDSACEVILEKGVPCLTVLTTEAEKPSIIGLFDFTDVNAFLTLAATSHLINDNDIDVEDRVVRILNAARNGKVPVRLCTDLSEKNPLLSVSQSDSVVQLLELFSRGAHRVIINETSTVISDMGLLDWLFRKAYDIEALRQLLEQPVSALELGSKRVISCVSTESVLDAMRIMSEQGLSSIAVTEVGTGDLLSTVTVTDITRVVTPSQSKKILTTSLSQLVALIKAPDGSEDGVDKYPVYSVLPNSTLSHAVQKLLATNTHRVFIIDDPRESVSIPFNGNLRGVISVVDVLSFFARLVGISNVDPTRMQRDRRASSASSSSTTIGFPAVLVQGSLSSLLALICRKPEVLNVEEELHLFWSSNYSLNSLLDCVLGRSLPREVN